MSTAITPITPPAVTSVGAATATTPKAVGPIAEFSSILSDAIGRVDQSNKAAQTKIDQYLSGENDEIHDTVMAVQKNELQFELFLQVRNKCVQAYQEVMRMQM